MTTLRRFMAAATAAQQEALAAAANTSRTADLASDIERASRKVRRANNALPVVLRTDLCPACARCEFAKSAQ